jgi:hypothetical protein
MAVAICVPVGVDLSSVPGVVIFGFYIRVTISTTKRVNMCWIPSPVAERIHAKK